MAYIGAGTLESPYQIWTLDDLYDVRNNLAAYYILMKNLDFQNNADYVNLAYKTTWTTGNGWPELGTQSYAFTGSFNGNNFAIANLFINITSANVKGLFGVLSGNVSKLTLNNVNVAARYFVGALAGQTTSGISIDRCHASGTIQGKKYVGGLVGSLDRSSVTKCSSSCNLTGLSDSNDFDGGGLIGLIYSYIINSTVSQCYSTGNVICTVGSQRYSAGGLVGRIDSQQGAAVAISQCFSTGDVTTHFNIGGLIGAIYAVDGSVSINDCFATGNLHSPFIDYPFLYLGGLLGRGSLTTTLQNCYSKGAITYTQASPAFLGGFAGSQSNATSCYWDTQTSGQATSAGTEVGKTTAEMIQQATYVGWDFVNVWNIEDGSSYPALDSILPLPVPDVPQNLTASNIGETSVTLSWDAALNATEYEVYQDQALAETTPDTSTEITGLAHTTNYEFAVKAMNPDNSSALSTPVSVKTLTTVVNGTMCPATATASSMSLAWIPFLPLQVIATSDSHVLVIDRDGNVSAWGDNSAGKCDVPAGLTGVVAVACGNNFSIALKNDGTVVGWGDNTKGQLNWPVNTNNIIGISAGYEFSCLLKYDGTVLCYGDNYYGQLNVPYTATDIVAVSCGSVHVLALKANGNVIAWGNNYSGESTVPGTLSGVIAIAAGSTHSVALKSDGTVVGWGNIIATPSGLTNVIGIASSLNHASALKSDGTVVQWGTTSYGHTTAPVGLSNVAIIEETGTCSVAITDTGDIVTWSSNNEYGVRDGAPDITVAIPTGNRYEVFRNAETTAFAVTPYNRFAATDSGLIDGTEYIYTVKGFNADDDMLGITSESFYTMLVAPTGLTAQPASSTVNLSWDAVTSATSYEIYRGTTLAQTVSSNSGVVSGLYSGRDYQFKVRAFNASTGLYSDFSSVLAVRTPILKEVLDVTPVIDGMQLAWDTSLFPYPIKQVSCGSTFTVIIKQDGTLVAFGSNTAGECNVPTGTFTSVVCDASYAIGLRTNGTVVGWGTNGAGQINVPVGLSGVVQIATGSNRPFALKSDGTVVGWGNYAPALVPAVNSDFKRIGAAENAFFGVKTNGTVVATGSSSYGTLAVPVGLNDVVDVIPSWAAASALKQDGSVVSWGTKGGVIAPSGTVIQMKASMYDTFALLDNGTVQGWLTGADGYSGASATMPAGLTDIVSLASIGGASIGHMFLLKNNRSTIAWGLNNYGQTTVPAITPNLANQTVKVFVDSAEQATLPATTVAYDFNAVLQPNTEYTFQVNAYDDSSVLVGLTNESVVLTKLATPVIAASDITMTSFTVSWAAVPDATQYEVVIDDVPYTTTFDLSIPVIDMIPASTVNVKVKATSASNESEYSNILPVTLNAVPIPTGLLASNVRATQFALSWDEVSVADNYDVLINGIGVATVAETSTLVTGMTPDTTVQATVIARYGAHLSDPSIALPVALNPATTTAPGGINVTYDAASNTITVSWANDPGADYYKVYYKTTYEGGYTGTGLKLAGDVAADSPVIVNAPETSVVFYDALPNTPYWFAVTSVVASDPIFETELAEIERNVTSLSGSGSVVVGKAPSEVDIVVDQSSHVINMTWTQEE